MPSTQIKVVDNLSVLMNKTITWNSQEKLQQTLRLGSSDGPHTIDVSHIDKIKMIAIYSESPFIVGITKDYTLSVLDTQNLFVYTPSVIDRSLIETISITAIDVSIGSIDISVFGESE